MDWKALYASWDRGEFAPVYLFHGEEELIKQDAVRRLRSLVLPAGLESLNETVLEGAVEVSRIIEAAETLPMMAERRLVLVRDWALLTGGRAKGESEEAARLVSWLPTAPSTCVTVFFLRGKCPDTGKAAKALRASAVEAAFDRLDEADTARWIRKRASAGGASIGQQAVEALVFAAGRDLTRLSGEVDKLAAHAGPGGVIGVQDVQELVAPGTESTVFAMIDRLIGGDLPAAQRLLDALLTAGESRVGVLYMITRQMRLLALARGMLDRGASPQAVENALSLRGFAARKLLEQARPLRTAAAEAAYRDCVDAEYALKSGQSREDLQLDRILLRIASLRREGAAPSPGRSAAR